MNFLYHRRGEERMRAAAAACDASREAHLGLSDVYAERIREARAPYGGEAERR
ncbi:MAG TPA: hypothetical protein VF552_04765 [Allosphingosinicella sp.]